jgi:hypothetical protein
MRLCQRFRWTLATHGNAVFYARRTWCMSRPPLAVEGRGVLLLLIAGHVRPARQRMLCESAARPAGIIPSETDG